MGWNVWGIWGKSIWELSVLFLQLFHKSELFRIQELNKEKKNIISLCESILSFPWQLKDTLN